MRRLVRIAAWTAGVVVALIVVAAGGVYVFVTSEGFRSRVESYAGTYAGRTTRIGDISIDWGSTAHVTLSNVEVANAEWGQEPHMLKAAQVDFDIRLWPLLKGDVVLPRLVLRKPEIAVEVSDKGQRNWSRGEAPVTKSTVEAAKPEHRFETPLIGHIEITDGRVIYRDPRRKLELDGTIATATGKAGDQPTAELQLKGKLEGQPLTVRFVGGSALMLRETSQPYPLDLDVAFGATKFALKGTVQDPFQWTGANVELALSGPDLSDIFPLLGIPGPPTPPYSIQGKLDRAEGVWKLHSSKWRVGESDLTGEVLIDERQKPKFLTARLTSKKLVFADLAPLVGAPPDRPGKVSPQQRKTQQQLEAAGDLFPNVPLKVERLRVMNADVTLDADRVIAPDYLPVQALSFRVVVDNGVATVKPLKLALVGSGSITGELAVDARKEVPGVRALLTGSNMEFGMFFRNSRFFDTSRGKIRTHVRLAGSGKSLAQVMGNADGHIEVAFAEGSVSALMVSLASLQLFDALILYVTGDKRIPILCALGQLNFNDGVVTFDRTLLDTQKSVLHVNGTVSLRSQVVRVAVKADPKSFDLLNLHGPVYVVGKIREPEITFGRSFPIPTPAFGDAQNVPCQTMTRQIFSK
jgi:uncharacterized protein involved in outer membrane biogenesis